MTRQHRDLPLHNQHRANDSVCRVVEKAVQLPSDFRKSSFNDNQFEQYLAVLYNKANLIKSRCAISDSKNRVTEQSEDDISRLYRISLQLMTSTPHSRQPVRSRMPMVCLHRCISYAYPRGTLEFVRVIHHVSEELQVCELIGGGIKEQQ